jgi:hypothetical protein
VIKFSRIVLLVLLGTSGALQGVERPRLAVLTDIGGDPDDQQSMVRLMAYANEFRIEALIASASGTPGELKESITRPDLILATVDAYAAVLPQLLQHASDWPRPNDLKNCVRSGNPHRGLKFIGDAHDTEGSALLIERIDAGNAQDRLNISIWGGQTDLAQALYRVKQDRGAAGLAEFVQKFRVFDIADQDAIADWIHGEFPGMFYILSKSPAGRDKRDATFRGMYLTGDQELTSQSWIDENVRASGALGALYPIKTWTSPNPHGCLKEGDTPSWFFFLSLGGNDPSNPQQPGWGGQYSLGDDGWYHDLPFQGDFDPRTTVSQWRGDFQGDFAKRMGWCR